MPDTDAPLPPSRMPASEISAIDAQHIWHPYAAPGEPTRVVRSTEGIYLELADASTTAAPETTAEHPVKPESQWVIDGMSSWWAACFGHSHPRLVDAAQRQISAMSHVMFGGLTHQPAAQLTQNLLALWNGTVKEQVFVPAPPTRGASPEQRADYLRVVEAAMTDEIAAMIIEPVVQGAGGMRFHDHELLVGIRELCTKHGIVLIADEIATGFGRTGDLFTTHAAGITPDILCVGKALTGGFMSLAATLATKEIAETMQPAALMHGPTFMANPLACAVASEATAMIREGHWREQVPRIAARLVDGLVPLREMPGVADVRVLGAIGVVEMDHDVDMATATAAALSAGVWIRPFGRLVYTMPPYICTDDEIATICRAIARIVAACGSPARAAH